MADPVPVNDLLEKDYYFDWISVPHGNGRFNSHSVRELDRYLRGNDYNDPMKVYRSLRFMTTRINRLLHLTQETRSLKIGQITPDRKKLAAQALLDDWKSGIYNASHINDGILVTMDTLDSLDCLCDIDTEVSKLVLTGKSTGTWLLRTSSIGKKGGEVAVFTVSYVHSSTVYHIRFCTIEGVGVYVTTRTHDGELPYTPMNTNILNENYLRVVLFDIDYKAPEYACITDALIDLNRKGYIRLNQMMSSCDVKKEFEKSDLTVYSTLHQFV